MRRQRLEGCFFDICVDESFVFECEHRLAASGLVRRVAAAERCVHLERRGADSLVDEYCGSSFEQDELARLAAFFRDLFEGVDQARKLHPALRELPEREHFDSKPISGCVVLRQVAPVLQSNKGPENGAAVHAEEL